MNKYITKNINDSLVMLQKIQEDKNLINLIEIVSQHCYLALTKGNKILLAGNGGSACDAQHFAGELVGRFEYNRKGLSAISLNDNCSSITAIANDFEYKKIFSRQMEALAKKDDFLIVFSTSGNSENIIDALQTAKKLEMHTVGLTGENGGKINSYCDYLINVPHQKTARIQEGHTLIIHLICGLIEKSFLK